MSKLSVATINIPRESLKKGVVILGLDEYYKMQTWMVPTYYLKGKRARDLDRLVEKGLEEYRAGRTVKASSLKEAMQIYNRRYGRRRV